jgi:hypothetical protein
MRRLIHLFLGLSMWLFLTSCALKQAADEHQERQSRMTASVNAYIGKSVADVALDRGPPTSTIDLGANKRGFQWEITTERPERSVPAPGSPIAVTLPPSEETCLVSFVASTSNPSPSLSDWIIESSQWKGGSC